MRFIILSFVLIFSSSIAGAENVTMTDFSLNHQEMTENFICEGCHLRQGKLLIKINSKSHSLNIDEYLQIDGHTFSDKVKPRCTNCHFNSTFTKEELGNFYYSKLGDKICYACHPDKKGNPEELSLEGQAENPFLQELKSQWLNKRGKVKAYREKMHLDQ